MKAGSTTIFLCALLLCACAQQATTSHDQAVALSLANAGPEPLRCRLMFGHWVDRDLGELAPGSATVIAMSQSAQDGALYVVRSDGQRRMMIETIQCSRPGHWMETVGQVDLAPVRSRRARAIEASCAVPASGGRTACNLDRID